MTDLIQVEPAPERRRAFARWAVAQNPKLDTVGPNTFAVPAELFTKAPEDILIGSLVDGHLYVSPQEDSDNGQVEELLGVATPAGLTAAPEPDELTTFPCDQCTRDFATERGRDAHGRQAHA
ncbi:hypothetical protein ACIO3O_37750 [Streptomyces sp. NPDC087440]|uniref:hypothetical protein n=1 Tax=Streptomyces sp. NPDC087440 TaxID=3365790 RepID=UPI00381FD963